jgi:hypothetical protein
MLQNASIISATKSKKEVRALGARERLFWLMDQKHQTHLTVTAEIKGITRVQNWRDALDAVQRRHPSSPPQSIETRRGNRLCIG